MKTPSKKSKKIIQKKTGQKKIKAKAKTKVQIKIKKAMPKSDIINNKATKKPTEEIVSQNQHSMEATPSAVNVQSYSVEKNEDYMNEKQLAHLHAILLQYKERLMGEIDHVTLHLQDETSNLADPIDRASKEEEFSLEVRSRDRNRKMLKKIEETLVRFNNHDYGYCVNCGSEIGIRRLEAHPTATKCVECKNIAEVKEKQIGEAATINLSSKAVDTDQD